MMLNPEYIVPIKMFSFQHWVAMLVILAIFIAAFLFRKFFMHSRKADMAFRYILGILMLSSEMGYYVYAGYAQKETFAPLLPTYLCGHLLWLVAIALFSNSARIIRLFAPMAITGGILSILFLNMEASFPHFRAFHYFIIHAGFMLGTLYFFFTKKVVKYTWRDFGRSCFTLFGMSSFIFMLNGFHLEDSYFLLNPPDDSLIALKEQVGQTAYTLLFMISISAIMFVWALLLYLFTRKRREEDVFLPKYRPNKFLKYLASFSCEKRWVLLLLPVFTASYVTVLQGMSKSRTLYFIDLLLMIVIFSFILLNEVSVNYKKEYA